MVNFGAKQVRLAVSLSLWNDGIPCDEQATKSWLEEVSDISFAGIEVDGLAVGEPILTKALAKSNLELAACRWQGNLFADAHEEIGHLEALLKVFPKSRKACLLYAEQPIDDEFDELDRGSDAMAKFATALASQARKLRRRGIRLCYMPVAGAPASSSADLASLVKATDTEVGIALDTGELAKAKIDPVPLVRMLGSRLRYIRCQDLRDDATTVPGDGRLDLGPLFKELANSRFGGWISIAGDPGQLGNNAQSQAIIGRERVEQLVDEFNLSVIDEHQERSG